jgi:hypothetical protein
METSIDLRGNDLRSVQSGSRRYSRSGLPRFVGLGILLLLALLGSASIASAQVSTASATTLKGIKIARGPDATSTNSVDWVNVPGATVSFTVGAGDSYLFVMRYTAESLCYGAEGYCPVRIMVNNTEAFPQVGYDFAFDSTDGGNASSEGWKSHAVDRSYHVTNTGTKASTVTLAVQYAVVASGISFRLDDWQFTVEQFQ